MSYDDFDRSDLHENCVPADDALSFVLENHWDEVEEKVNDSRGQAWLARNKPFVELLSIVSQRDREHMRGAIKTRLRKKHENGDEPSDDQLFAIAADVSAFLEQFPKTRPLPPITYQIGPGGYQGSHQPTADRSIAISARDCSLDGDLSWARELLVVSRAFRDFLSSVSDPDVSEPVLRLRISKPIGVFNSYLQKTPAQVLIYWQPGDRQLRFGRCPDPLSPDLPSLVANWISDYLENHYSYIGLGVCAECGKFFERERRDKTFCSKTCQNRVAYKRKKLLESNALAPVNIPPDCAYDISAGLWTHHPRYGIGLVESVTSGGTEMVALLAKVPAKPDEAARYRSMLSRKISVQIRFLHGLRTLRYSDLFEGQKNEDQVPTFYEVKSEETLAELL